MEVAIRENEVQEEKMLKVNKERINRLRIAILKRRVKMMAENEDKNLMEMEMVKKENEEVEQMLEEENMEKVEKLKKDNAAMEEKLRKYNKEREEVLERLTDIQHLDIQHLDIQHPGTSSTLGHPAPETSSTQGHPAPETSSTLDNLIWKLKLTKIGEISLPHILTQILVNVIRKNSEIRKFVKIITIFDE